MIVPIVVDTQSITDQFTQITPEQVNNMLDNVAKGLSASFAANLELEAQGALHQTLGRYLKAIKVIDSGKLEGTILLDYSKDKMVQMLEEGATPFDMKQGFLLSQKVKTTKKGIKYLTIPFRWATPKAVGDADVFAAKMPQDVYKIAKALQTNKPTVGGFRSDGIKISQLPQALQVRQTRPTINDNLGNPMFQAYQHKNSIYEGIIKSKDGATGQNRYGSFRRVSENSDPDAFIHPGIEKYNLIQRSLSSFDVGKQMTNLMDNELTKLGLL